jgi:hypothetical protein
MDGEYGVRENIRTYKDVVQDSSWSKVIIAELFPGLAVTSWAVASGSVYVGATVKKHDSVRLDVTRVSTLLGDLTRSYASDPTTLAAGEFWYDVDAEATDSTWDDGETYWDDGSTRWDEFVKLYVRMPDSSDPEDSEVEAEFKMTFANKALTVPSLGDDMMTNGSFETIGSGGASEGDSTTFTGWNNISWVPAGGTDTVTWTSDALVGDRALRFDLDNIPEGGPYVQRDFTVTPGQAYRLSAAYRMNGSRLAPMIYFRNTADNNGADVTGRQWTVGGHLNLNYLDKSVPMDGSSWRRVTLDAVVPAGMTTLRVILGGFAMEDNVWRMANGTVDWDDVKLLPIERMQYHEPRITAANVPTIQTASNDIFFGGKQIGVGGVAFLNHDSYFETLSTMDWINRRCVLKVGGYYLDSNEASTNQPRQECLASDDFRVAFTGLIKDVKVDDVEAAFDIQDVRSAYFRSVPTRAYTRTDFANIADADEGRPRALWFGRKTHVRPIRYNVGTTYGKYELADCTDAPNGINEITQVWSYTDEDAAGRRDSSKRVRLNYKRQSAMGTATPVGAAASGWNATEQTVYRHGTAAWDYGYYFGDAADLISSGENARFEVTVGSDTTISRFMYGLTQQTMTTGSYDQIDYALYCNHHTTLDFIAVYEAGVNKWTSSDIYCRVHDRARVQMKDDGTVEYWYCGQDTDYQWTLVYTSLTSASGSYKPCIAMFDTNAYATGVGVYRDTDLHYTPDLANGRLDLSADVRAIEVTTENMRFEINDNGTTRTCRIPTGVYVPEETLWLMTASAAGATFKAGQANKHTYSTTTHKWTLGSASNVEYLFSSSEYKNLYQTFGFTQEDPGVAETSSEAEGVFYTSDDDHFILRADGQGFKDDASGTYTTVANGLIEVGADVLRTILVAVLKNDASVADEASFQSARERAPESVAIHMSKEWSLKDIMETLEWTNVANISIGGDGTVFYDVYTGDVPAGTPVLEDTDFSSFAITWEAADVYRTVRTYYDEDPEGNFYLYRGTENPDVEARFGRPEIKEFKTWLTFTDAAAANSSRMAELAKTPARQLRGTVRGKLLDSRVGQKVRVTRDRAAESGGLLSSSVYRIISIRQNHAMGLSQLIAVPDVVTVAGVACITTCQSYCEQVCQASCETACQSTCQLTCQSGCEVACQSCEQTACQDTCELDCQTTCELTCQTGCQVGCETGCQVSCQSGCQVSCQTGCEVSCQTTCEASCQATCELSCQDTCELSCQTSCEIACQFKCEQWCQGGEGEYIP